MQRYDTDHGAGLLDDLSDDGDLAMWAEMSGEAIAIITRYLDGLSLVEANDYVRRLAEQLLDELGAYMTEWETGFCRSILVWVDHRRFSVKQIKTLHMVGRNAAGRALIERRACHSIMAAVPANRLPA
jgi:hypothetical protein